MKRTLVAVLLATALAPIGCGSADVANGGGAGAGEAADAAAPASLAQLVAIDEVSIFQAVKVTLAKEGALVEKTNAPVIANRPAVIRVWARALDKTRPMVEAELTLVRPGKPDLVLRNAARRTATTLDDGNLATTFNFEVAAEEIAPETRYSVKVAERIDGAKEVLAFPADGSSARLDAKTSSQSLKVKFVPISMDNDGAEIVPDLKDLSLYRDTLYKLYPVAAIDVSVREQPLKWSQVVEPDGEGWDDLLSGLMQMRRADQSARDVYYVGVFTPKPSIDEFCSRGSCVLGIAPQADERDVSLRIALVLGYKNRSAGGTLAQELAHAMGRGHAPCGGAGDPDPYYPYERAYIGVWGYDVLEKTWLDPQGRSRDFMSYCSPVWTSDYTYQGIFERMDLITQQMAELTKKSGTAPAGAGGSVPGAGAVPQAMQTFRIAKDGSVHAGPEIDELPGVETGETVPVTYEGAGGVVTTTRGAVRKIIGTGGKIVIAPAAPKAALRARVSGLAVTDLRARSSFRGY